MNAGTPLRVAILGAACSGKSTLAAALARRHGTLWVPEYLREFVDTHGRVPRAEDQLGIASTQLAREDAAAARASGFLFCDTSPLMTAIYSRHYFGAIDPALARLADAHQYHLTLVTASDIPWVADGLQRECEQVSRAIDRMLFEELAARAIPYRLLEGDLETRLAQAEQLMRR